MKNVGYVVGNGGFVASLSKQITQAAKTTHHIVPLNVRFPRFCKRALETYCKNRNQGQFNTANALAP